MADANLELELRLDNITELFHAPALDPLHQVFDDRSGMQQILDELQANSASRTITVTVRLPSSQLTDELETQSRTALVEYCRARVQQQNRKIAALQRRGIRALQVGVVFWAICLLLSILFFGMEAWSQFFSHFLGEGFLIVGWVSLWYPTEVLLFERWEMTRERRYYERLQDLTLYLRAY